MILIFDNYDSFVHNLARYFRQLGFETTVLRNDEVNCEQVRRMKPEAIVISPGPCTPDEAGCSIELVRELGSEVPMLGVCLGHQVIAQAYGGKVVRAVEPIHGRTSDIFHNRNGLFDGIPTPMTAGRYHSLVVESTTLPACLKVTAQSDDKSIMAIEHESLPIFGVQFHPESVLTELGYVLLANFLRLSGLDVLLSNAIPGGVSLELVGSNFFKPIEET